MRYLRMPRIAAAAEWTFSARAFEFLQRSCRLRDNLVAFALRTAAPSLPLEAKELVQHAGAFKSERNGREIGQRILLGGSDTPHPNK